MFEQQRRSCSNGHQCQEEEGEEVVLKVFSQFRPGFKNHENLDIHISQAYPTILMLLSLIPLSKIWNDLNPTK